ncbi:MAG: sulfite exporter TauE/SafE family protein [Salinivirgaceae bacterium]|jgi:nickel/cobalt exporter|nr:sulfite exporter TauE/SafE family protein [Salinivirgaceae bacterium]
MNNELIILTITAATLGFIHTLFGPDHYLPFVVMSKARNWTTFKTVWITLICGVGHIGSSVLLGTIGVAFGIGVSKLEFIESVRGDWAAWAFLIFGTVYLLWGLRKAYLNKPHKHIHMHGEVVHKHEHNHSHSTADTEKTPHTHTHKKNAKNLTPWILFLVFVLGPCEPLIPILMYPAAQHSIIGVISVTAVFGIATLATMTAMVLLLNFGVSFINIGKLERYTHAIAGGTVAFSGILILLGL